MKFLWVFIIALWLFNLRDITSVAVVSFTTAVFAFLTAKLELRRYLSFSVVIFLGSGFLTLYQGIFRPGPGIHVGPVALSYAGMSLGLAIGLRTFGLIASSLAFSISTSPQDFELALIKIRMPYKIARICYLSLRLIPIFQRDLQTIEDVQNLRGVEKGWNRVKASIVTLIATELRQADNISIALETRGFGLYNVRTELKEVSISHRGIVLVAFTLFLMIFHLTLNILL